MIQALDGPALQGTISVGTGAIIEVKVGGSALSERKIVTIQPLDGSILVYFADNGVTPSLSDLNDDGFIQYKRGLHSYEASDQQAIYILATSGTVDVKIAERA